MRHRIQNENKHTGSRIQELKEKQNLTVAMLSKNE